MGLKLHRLLLIFNFRQEIQESRISFSIHIQLSEAFPFEYSLY